jgi:hypothetical protein
MTDVTIFADAGYQGASQTLTLGRYDDAVGQLSIGNDRLSSLQVPQGVIVRLYEHAHFQGQFIDIALDTPALAPAWNDRASSIIVYAETDPPPWIQHVVIFEHAQFGGASQVLNLGDVDATQLQIGIHSLSSALVPLGLVLRLYEQAGFQGASLDIAGDTPAVPLQWNDRATSIRVFEAFPENDLAAIRDYLGTHGADPAPNIQTVQAALGAALGNIQDHNPFPPHNLINIPAVRRRTARARLHTFLGSLGVILHTLYDAYGQIAKGEFGLAETALAAIPLLGPDITAGDIAEAFATTPLTYWNFSGSPTEPTQKEMILAGYSGPQLDASELLAAHELVAGGPERTTQLGMLRAELLAGRHDIQSLVQAIQAYATLLPQATTTAADLDSLHVDLFEHYASLDARATLTARQKWAAIRSAFAHLALGDTLFRRQRNLGEQDRQLISAVYQAALRLVQQSCISPTNPRRQEIELHAAIQHARLQSHLNYLGLWDAFVPIPRYLQLEADAKARIEAAQKAADDYAKFLQNAETEALQQMDLQFQQAQERLNLSIVGIQQTNATLDVSKIDEQLHAIDDQRASIESALGMGLLGSIMDLDPAKTALGIVSAFVHASAQGEELAHQRRIAEIERQIAKNGVDIADLNRQLSEQRLAFYKHKLDFVANKQLNADFLYTLAELNRKRAERQLDAAVYLAYLFERALAFFLGEPAISHIQFDYLNRQGGIFDAANALAEDFQHVLDERDRVDQLKFDFFEQAISLRESYPLQFSRLIQTGQMDFEFSLYQLSKLRPATHQCRLREVGVEVRGLIPATGFSGTLTHRGRFLVRDRDATLQPEMTRLIPTDAQLAQALDDQRRQGLAAAAVGGVLMYDLDADTKELSLNTQFVSPVPPNQETLSVFEGYGPTGLWRLELMDHERLVISDVVLHFAIVSRESDIAMLEPRVRALIRSYEDELAQGDALDRISAFSLRESFPDTFDALQNGQAMLPLTRDNFPAGLTDLQFKLLIVQALDMHNAPAPGVSLAIQRGDAGFSQLYVTRADGYSEDLDAAPQPLPVDRRFPVAGAWQLQLSDSTQFALLGDIRLFMLYAVREA